MKSLRALALLPLAAAAAQAYTVELQLGQSRTTGYDQGTVAGLNIAGHVSQSVSLGLNLSNKKIDNDTASTRMRVRNASLDIAYEMNPRGAIHPFIGAGVGYAWLSDATTITNSKGVTTTSLFGGIRFELSRSVDIALNFRNNQLLSVPDTAGVNKNTIKNWDSTVGLRFKF